MILVAFGAALLVAVVAVVLLVPRLQRAEIVGRDMHKPRRNKIPQGRAGKPEVAEMGGWRSLQGRVLGFLSLWQ